MSGSRHLAALVAAIVLGTLSVGGLVPSAARAAAPDKSEVVLALDFSASILDDKATRDRFAAALVRMADRVDATAADLVAGDATVSLVQFAAKAVDVPGCTDLHLLTSPGTVGRFADCLRKVAGAYRKGLDRTLQKKVGVDTNYVAAMQQADKHLPDDAVRPAMILFTDGKHDVKGVPVSHVQIVRDQLFGTRSPFALLPVGMGLDAKERGALEAGLTSMRITRDMPACVSGATFDWPQVVFESPDEAGNAVAVALQDATCTFTVAATPGPPPVPTPAVPATPNVAAVPAVAATPGSGRIDLAWTPIPASAPGEDVVDYRARCRPADGGDDAWIESTEGVSLQPTTTVAGLTDGTPYQCEVAAVSETGVGPWTAVAGSVTPVGRPAAPVKPAVEPLNGGVVVQVDPAPSGAATLHFECSADGGKTWPTTVDVATGTDPRGELMGLTNGVEYVCRAFGINAIGVSDASPMSDAIRPCSSMIDCYPILVPVVGLLGAVLAVLGLLAALAFLRSRRRGYVLVVVDVVHTANLGYGSKLGIGFIRDPDSKRVTGVVADSARSAEIRIRHHKGGFEVTDRHGKHLIPEGDPLFVTDALGARHEVVLRAFDTNAASPVATRR